MTAYEGFKESILFHLDYENSMKSVPKIIGHGVHLHLKALNNGSFSKNGYGIRICHP